MPTIFYVLFLVVVVNQIADPTFLHRRSCSRFLKQAAPLVLLGVGQLFVLVAGEFDLSVGALITVLSVAAAELISGDPDKTLWVMGVMLLIAVVVGVGNGVITNVLRCTVVHRHAGDDAGAERRVLLLDQRRTARLAG